MRNALIFICCCVVLSGCSKKEAAAPLTINVDVFDAEVGNLKDYASDIKAIPIVLPDSIFFGEISFVKKSNGQYFLLDREITSSITIIDEQGNYVNQLKRYGGGPEEYENIENFALSDNNELIVYDRARLRVNYYSLPGLEYIRSYKVEDYWMGLELIDENTLLVVNDSDTDEGGYKGVQIVNASNWSVKDERFGDYPMAIEASFEQAITKNSNVIYYSRPGEKTIIYRVTKDGFTSIAELDFGKSAMDQKYWQLTEIGDFMRRMNQEEKVASAYAFVESEMAYSFWYMYKSRSTHYVSIYDKVSGKLKTLKRLEVEGLNHPLSYPTGITEGEYLHVVYPQNMNKDFLEDDTNKDNPLYRASKKVSQRDNPVLLVYKLATNG